MMEHDRPCGVSYPTAFARILAGFASYPGYDWGRFAADLVALAGRGDSDREWLENELTDSHEKPDEWSKPCPPRGLMADLMEALGVNEGQQTALALAYTFGEPA